jgi:hypothetical protein
MCDRYCFNLSSAARRSVTSTFTLERRSLHRRFHSLAPLLARSSRTIEIDPAGMWRHLLACPHAIASRRSWGIGRSVHARHFARWRRVGRKGREANGSAATLAGMTIADWSTNKIIGSRSTLATFSFPNEVGWRRSNVVRGAFARGQPDSNVLAGSTLACFWGIYSLHGD